MTRTTWSATPLAVECRGLTYRFGSRTAVDGIDLCVRPGEVFGLLGANGAGKTTTIRVLTTLRTALTKGTIILFIQHLLRCLRYGSGGT